MSRKFKLTINLLHCPLVILYIIPKLLVMLEQIVSDVSPNRSENIYVFTLGNYSNSNEHVKPIYCFYTSCRFNIIVNSNLYERLNKQTIINLKWKWVAQT